MLEGGWPRLALMNPTNPAGSKSLCLQCDVDWRQVQGLFAVVRQEVQDFGKIRFGNFVGITCLEAGDVIYLWRSRSSLRGGGLASSVPRSEPRPTRLGFFHFAPVTRAPYALRYHQNE
jgi:hypothetical protein